MTCVQCGSKMNSTRGAHRYTESGLSNVILLNVETRSCPECGEREVVIPKIEQLHRLIARALVKQPGRLAPPHIRFLRQWLGWSTADFATIMGVRPETVSRWESKDAGYPIPPTADRLIRLLVVNHEPIERYPVDLLKAPAKATSAVVLKFTAPDWKKAA